MDRKCSKETGRMGKWKEFGILGMKTDKKYPNKNGRMES
jgi:hypothetical protein